MPEQRDALTELVKAHVGSDRQWSTREFAAAAVDPDSGWSPSKSLIGKIIDGQGYNITPQLVSALAAGLELPREVVAAAAHLQTIGYEAEQLADGPVATVIRVIDRPAGQPMPRAKAIADKWDTESASSEG